MKCVRWSKPHCQSHTLFHNVLHTGGFEKQFADRKKKEPPDIPEPQLQGQAFKTWESKVKRGQSRKLSSIRELWAGVLLPVPQELCSPISGPTVRSATGAQQIQTAEFKSWIKLQKGREIWSSGALILRVHVTNKQLSHRSWGWQAVCPTPAVGTISLENLVVTEIQHFYSPIQAKKIKMLFIISTSCLILVQKKSTILWKATFIKKGGNKDHPNPSP